MEAIVRVPYTDRLTCMVHYAGETVELTGVRFAELSRGGYVESALTAVSPPVAPDVDAPVADPVGDAPDFAHMTKAALRGYAEAHGVELPAKATNAEIIAAIMGAV